MADEMKIETPVNTTPVETPVVAVAETTPTAPKEKKVKAPKVTHYIIHVDANGKELSRDIKGKGRPPRGATAQPNGDFIVSPLTSPTRFVPEYITLDESGKELSRVAKGRGRPKPGFTKQTGGVNDGHWVLVQTATPVVTPTVVATETPAATA